MRSKSSLPLILIIVGLSVIGILFAASEGDYAPCPQPTGAPTYLRAVSVAPPQQPLSGAKVSGSIQWLCATTEAPGYIMEYSSIPQQATPANGTVFLAPTIGNYSLSVQYQGENYAVSFSAGGGNVTLVTVSIPGGTTAIANCTVLTGADCVQ